MDCPLDELGQLIDVFNPVPVTVVPLAPATLALVLIVVTDDATLANAAIVAPAVIPILLPLAKRVPP